jgi:hypothetical protein
MPKLEIVGWRIGLKKISMTQILPIEIFPSLVEAKACTDNVLAGKEFEFNIEDEEKVRRVAKDLEDIGAVVEVESD